jgi:hypothetical protein
MGIYSNSFSKTHQPPRESKRRKFAETLLLNSLQEYGFEMLAILIKYANYNYLGR